MIKKFSLEDKIGDIVTKFPGASDIFYQHHVDFCCGGNRPLAEANEDKNIDLTALLEELNIGFEAFTNKNNEFIDWVNESPKRLMDYIVQTHHNYLREELPKLSEYLFKILKVHGRNHQELFTVHKLFNHLRTELEGHLVKEEEFLFPFIETVKKSQSAEAQSELLELMDEIEGEHVGAGDILKELREVTDHYSIPEDTCKTFEITYNKLKALELDLFQHIHLENNILFAR